MTLPTPVLVTGGAGFLGSHLARSLLALGVEVRLLDDLSGGRRENLPAGLPPERFVVGDVRDEEAVFRAAQGCRALVHLVDRPVPPEDPWEGLEVHARGTLAVMRAARRAEVARVVLASSCAAYGASGAPPLAESRAPGPVSLVGAAKVGAEAIVRTFAEAGAFQAVVLRFFHVYGAGRITSRSPGVLALFGQAVAEGRAPQVHGSGEVARDFVHVDDAVLALRLSLERRVGNWTLANVGTGVGTSIRSAAEAVAEALGRLDLEPVSVESPPGPSVSSFADLRYARSALGFEPRVSLAQGLARKDFHLPVPPDPA